MGTVEIPNQTSISGDNAGTVFHGYRKGGFSPLVRDGGHEKIPMVSSLCHSGGDQPEDFRPEIFSSFPFPSGTANTPENVSKRGCFLQSLKKAFD